MEWADLAESGVWTIRAMVEANCAICYEWDLSTDAARFWGRFDRLLGIRENEVPTTMDEWLLLLHPNDAARVVAENQESISGLGPFVSEYRMVCRDGSHVFIQDCGQVLTDADGNACKKVGGIRNVTHERMIKKALRERNIALRVILEQRNLYRLEVERNVRDNLQTLIIPALDRIRRSLGSRPEAAQLDSLRASLEEIMNPFSRRLEAEATPGQPLTQRQLEIIDLLRKGKTTTEIAGLLFLSPATVSYHRANIRRKLNLPRNGTRLTTFLGALSRDESIEEGLRSLEKLTAGDRAPRERPRSLV